MCDIRIIKNIGLLGEACVWYTLLLGIYRVDHNTILAQASMTI